MFYFDEEEYTRKHAAIAKRSGLSGDYMNRFFTPFTSITDAKQNMKAMVVRPTIDAFLLMHTVIDMARDTLLTAIDFALLDGHSMLDNGKNMISHLPGFIHALTSLIAETTCVLLQFLTHSLTTCFSIFTALGSACSKQDGQDVDTAVSPNPVY